MLSLTEKAEVLLRFAYAGIPLEDYKESLEFTEQLHVITNIDHNETALFIADIHSIRIPTMTLSKYYAYIYSKIKEVPYPPIDVFGIIKRTKYFVLRENIEPRIYYRYLVSNLEKGVPLEKISEILSKTVNIGER